MRDDASPSEQSDEPQVQDWVPTDDDLKLLLEDLAEDEPYQYPVFRVISKRHLQRLSPTAAPLVRREAPEETMVVNPQEDCPRLVLTSKARPSIPDMKFDYHPLTKAKSKGLIEDAH